MKVFQILNLLREFHLDLSESEIKCLIQELLHLQKANDEENYQDVLMMKVDLRLEMLNHMKRTDFESMQLELFLFSAGKPIAEDSQTDENAEQILEWLYLKTCFGNELRIWMGFANDLPSELYILVKYETGFCFEKRRVYFYPYGHPPGALRYKNAQIVQHFLLLTLKIVQMYVDFNKLGCPNRYHEARTWDKYFTFQKRFLNHLSNQTHEKVITFCHICSNCSVTISSCDEFSITQLLYSEKLIKLYCNKVDMLKYLA